MVHDARGSDSALRRKEILTRATVWTNLEDSHSVRELSLQDKSCIPPIQGPWSGPTQRQEVDSGARRWGRGWAVTV